MTIDTAVRHQTLVGFGASLAYADDAIVAHPDKAALYDLLFAESGLDVLRLRNRYEGAGEAVLQPAREIVTAASERLGRTPFLFMTSGTPPAALKANGSRTCGGDPETCTLASLPGGGFDYAGFAGYWRASLEAYANAGIVPDYVSIQNNPNWVPPAAAPNDACRFLPEEGTTTVTVDGAPVDVAYPGYREALSAVRAAIADLPVVPRLGAPESGLVGVSEFVPALDASAFDALALHLYGVDATAVDVAALGGVRAWPSSASRPVFQTEMQADGLETAILIHHALTAGGRVRLPAERPRLADARHGARRAGALDRRRLRSRKARITRCRSMRRARIRVGSASTQRATRPSSSARRGSRPTTSALTVVLVNPGTEDLDAELVLPDALRSAPRSHGSHAHGLRRHRALRRARRAARERYRACPGRARS